MIIKKGTTNLKIIISDHYLRFKKLRCDYSQGIRTFMKTENTQLPPVPLLLSFVLRKIGKKETKDMSCNGLYYLLAANTNWFGYETSLI
jgi:hypothetical protein